MKVAVIGAGPAGLSAAHTLSNNGVSVTVFEKDEVVGGISRTVVKGEYRFDLGGHRFFTKSKKLNRFIDELMQDELIDVGRKSRIYFRKRYLNYPLEARNAIFGLGILTAVRILLSYIWQRLKRPFLRKEIATLEDWVVDKFGYKMFSLYFKSYTEKVWGISCDEIEAEWVAQRIKGMSLSKAVKSAFRSSRSDTPTTLIRQFKYPKLGIGRICERMAESISKKDEVVLSSPVISISTDTDRVLSLTCRKAQEKQEVFTADEVISSMPITELLSLMDPLPPKGVLEAAARLNFRDFIAVTLMIDKRRVTEDTWLYIHEPDIKFGRIHEPKNWSPYMAPGDKTSLVMEYFCFEGDDTWSKSDEELADITRRELVNKLGFMTDKDIIGYHVVRVIKAYPMYDVGYRQYLTTVLTYLKRFKNLQLVGRNGTFRYNNMDHSLEMGIRAAGRLLGEDEDIFSVNSSDEYLEEMRT